MTKTIESLIPDIYTLFDGDIDSINIGVSHEQRGGDNHLRMSNLGKPLRQLYYDLTSAPNKETLSGQVHFKFKYGHILEDLVIALAIQAGHDVTDQQKEVVVDGVKGHIDGIIDGVLVDAKSCSPYSFEKFRSGAVLTDDPFGYIYQLSSYWACLPSVDRAGFLAINKVNGDLFFYELPTDKRRSLEDVRQRIVRVRDTVDAAIEPDRCYEPVPEGKSGNLRLGVGCSYCPHKNHCWRDANDGKGPRVYYYSGGPKFLVKVVKEPKVRSDETEIDTDLIDTFPKKEQV